MATARSYGNMLNQKAVSKKKPLKEEKQKSPWTKMKGY